MRFNCVSYALKLEEDQSTLIENLDWTLPPVEAIRKLSQSYGLLVREIPEDAPLFTGEWRVCFFGFVPIAWDYEGRPKWYDYHLIRQNEDGLWYHRKTWKATITVADLEEITKEYGMAEIHPIFFAMKKAEE